MLKIVRDGTVLRVDGATGGFSGVPATLAPDLLTLLNGYPSPRTNNGRAQLDIAVGTPCAWACIPLPSGHSQAGIAWLVLGSPRQLPAEAIVAIGSLANQVTLALQNSDVHQELTEQATLDSLTGLANRPSFNAAVAAAIDDEPARPTTVLFVDLDDFKDVNDLRGHGAGDELLREIAARLRRATRPGDLCARLGGDEFAVLLRSTDGATAAEVAHRIVRLSRPWQPPHTWVVAWRISAPVSASPQAPTRPTPKKLVHRADVAMYAAKANGKGRVQIFEAGLLQGDSTRVLFERQLTAASETC